MSEGSLAATRGDVTRAELAAVKPATRKQYDYFLELVRAFIQRHGLPPLAVDEHLETTVTDVISALFEDGAPAADGQKVTAALWDAFPILARRHSGLLARAERAVRGMCRRTPPRSRLPMPEQITLANVVTFLSWGDLAGACQLWLSHELYLRPCEARAIRIGDINRPLEGASGELAKWSVTLAPEDRGTPTKTHVFDDTLSIDRPLLVELVEEVAKGKNTTEFLFGQDQTLFRRRWKTAQEALGLRGTCLYQLRHGGASADTLSKRRGLLEVMTRGRWESTKSLKRYAKAGKVHQLMRQLSEAGRSYVAWSSEHLEAFLEKQMTPLLPEALGGPPSTLRPTTVVLRRPAAADEGGPRKRPAAA